MKFVRTGLVALSAVFCISCGTCFAQILTNLDLEWTRILGANNENAYGMGAVVFPDGYVYAAGHATGPFDGKSNPGSQSVCVVKWDAAGSQIWSTVFGSTGNENVEGVARDNTNIYIAGYSDGTLGTNIPVGANDAFLVKLDTNENIQFQKLWGSTNIDQAHGVAYGPGDPFNVYVAGHTEGSFGEWPVGTPSINTGTGPDAFLTKWNPGGTTQLWTRIWGSEMTDFGRGVAVAPDGSVYVAGDTFGEFHGQTNPGGNSAFLTKFDQSGTDSWTRIWGSTNSDYVEEVAIDGSGAIYVVGYTLDEFNSQTNNGGADAFLSVFDPTGAHLWTKIWGSTNDDYASGVAVGSDYIVRVSGYTYSSVFCGHTNQGTQNAFLSLWGSGGIDVTHVLFGGTNETGGTSVALGPDDTAHVPGYTKSGFDGASPVSSGSYPDLFLSKISSSLNTNPVHVWNLGGTVMGSPAISDDGLIYVSLLEDAGNNVFALNSGGSTQDAAFMTGGYSSPALGADGNVYVGANTGGCFYSYSTNLSVNHEWYVTPLAGDYSIGAPAVGTSNIIYACSQGGAILAFHTTLHTTEQIFQLSGYINSAPAIGSDGNIYVGSDDGRFYGLNPGSSFTQFVHNVGAAFNSSPAIGYDGTIYVGCDASKLFAFNPDGTTQRVWSTGGAISSSPAIGEDGTIYVGCDDFKLYAFNYNGTTQRVWTTGGAIKSSPALGDDGTIYVGSGDGKLYAFNADGSTSKVYSTVAAIYSSPTIAMDGTVYIGSSDSNLYAFVGTGGGPGSGAWPKYRQNLKNWGRSQYSPLPAPAGMGATTGLYASAVGISWNPVGGANGFDVWRGTNSDFQSAVFLGNTTMTNFYDSTVTPERRSYYWVKACSSPTGGQSPFSGPVMGWRILSQPLNVFASQGDYTNSISVSWDSVMGATGFEVWRNTSSNWSGASNVATHVSNLSYYDSVASTSVFYYWVAATNIYGKGGFSELARGYAAPDVQTGTLIIDVSPNYGTWTLLTCPAAYTGRRSWTGDYTMATAPIGTYMARFGAIDYYDTPSDASSSVTVGTSTTLAGFYTPLDSDGDGLTDLDEVNIYGTDPYNPDSDGDGYSDGSEVYYGSDPLNADSYPCGDLVFSSPVAGMRAKAGKRLPVAWSGSFALGQADIFLAQGTSFWNLAEGISCPDPYSSNSVTLPQNLRTGSNYHVKVAAASGTAVSKSAAGAMFGDSGLFSIVSDCKGDYDADGRADLSMYFPPWGMWFILRSNKGFYYQQFGWDGPTPVPADYDGDGRTDIAVHDPLSGYWYILTWDYQFYWLEWGASMAPVPADYDGDGRIDFAAYDENGATWHIMQWNGSSYSIYLGGQGYKAVPGDYDGDRMANAAVYDKHDGTWYILSASGYDITTIQLGGPGFMPVPNDFDGDGIMDPAVYDSATGTWYIYKSSTGLKSVQFGFTDAMPVSGDYDGDGKADLGVVYGPLGLWYRLLSADGTMDYLQFGWSGIIPLE